VRVLGVDGFTEAFGDRRGPLSSGTATRCMVHRSSQGVRWYSVAVSTLVSKMVTSESAARSARLSSMTFPMSRRASSSGIFGLLQQRFDTTSRSYGTVAGLRRVKVTSTSSQSYECGVFP
jgi:hypothetical protein